MGQLHSSQKQSRKYYRPRLYQLRGSKFKTAESLATVPLFEASDDWKLQFDVCVKRDGQSANAPFPPHIAATSFRPDGVMWSDKLKTVAWVELTSPWEDNLSQWHFKKHEKYSKLAETVRGRGWTLHPLCIEVGARGKTNDTWLQMAKAFSMASGESKTLS